MPDKNLTDNEIVKALECCSKAKTAYDCEKLQCPCFSNPDMCIFSENDGVILYSLDLINRLQADCENYKKIAEHQQSVTMDRGFEINRLKAENEELKSAINGFRGYEDKIKAEAYKEFADRLKEIDGKDNHTFDDCASILVSEEYKKGRYEKTNEIWGTIDDLLNELVGGEK